MVGALADEAPALGSNDDFLAGDLILRGCQSDGMGEVDGSHTFFMNLPMIRSESPLE